MKIVSLGTNCETSFRIQDYTGKPIDSYIFSWTAAYNPIKQIEALENLRSLEESDWFPAKNRMVINQKFNIGFHFKDLGKNLFNEQGKLNKEEYDTGLIELKSRMAHLIDKTEQLFKNPKAEDILFVYKAEMYKEEHYANNYLLYVISYLYTVLQSRIKKGDFMLLVLVDDKELFNSLSAAKIAPNVLFQYLTYFPDNTQRNAGGDKLGWNNAFHNAVNEFEKYKLEKYNKNLIKGLQQKYWGITKSGDATGSYDPDTRMLSCKATNNYYWGIMYNVDLKKLPGSTLKLSLKISGVRSERKDIGYLQIWENYVDSPNKAVSAFLLNINQESQYYEFFYKVPKKLKSLRVVIQAKNGSFKIDDISLKRTLIN